MKVMVVGSGGREHALVKTLAASSEVSSILSAPGNPGTAAHGTNVQVAADDVGAIDELARRERVGLVVVGPEVPLCKGLADRLRAGGIAVFGPSQAAAEIEGSKAFSKELMNRQGIPTAAHRVFRDRDGMLEYLDGAIAWPVVLKASGLASGKGVIICRNIAEATEAADTLMVKRTFGASGETVVVEDFIAGDEVSVHCLTDGRTLVTLPTSQDHKRALDGDQGPNTGGMGAISPAAGLDGAGIMRLEREVLFPAIHALERAKRKFSGVLFAGIMLTRSGPKVLEFNARFGDPETQVILPRLKGDLFRLLWAVAKGELEGIPESLLEWDTRASVGVVLCSGGYPGAFRKGVTIEGIEDAEALPGVSVLHAGTARVGGRLVTDGGRVLTVTAMGSDLLAARKSAYDAVAKIHFEDMHFRTDIGARASCVAAG